MTPLFIANEDELKANLRLSGASTLSGSDFSTLLEQAGRKVRVGFQRRLGSNLIARIQADSGFYREMAELAEISWVKLELSYLLPVLFMDAAAGAREAYNDEAAFRKAAQEDLKAIQRQLNLEVQQHLEGLSGWVIEGPSSNRISSIGPDRPTIIGESGR